MRLAAVKEGRGGLGERLRLAALKERRGGLGERLRLAALKEGRGGLGERLRLAALEMGGFAVLKEGGLVAAMEQGLGGLGGGPFFRTLLFYLFFVTSASATKKWIEKQGRRTPRRGRWVGEGARRGRRGRDFLGRRRGRRPRPPRTAKNTFPFFSCALARRRPPLAALARRQRKNNFRFILRMLRPSPAPSPAAAAHHLQEKAFLIFLASEARAALAKNEKLTRMRYPGFP